MVSPNSLSDLNKLFDLEWRGGHAPTELEKILKATGHAMIVKMDASIEIVQISKGPSPVIPADRLIGSLPFLCLFMFTRGASSITGLVLGGLVLLFGAVLSYFGYEECFAGHDPRGSRTTRKRKR